MYGAVFAASDAVSGALFSVVADFGAYCGERVILEENLSSFHELMLFEELDDLRNWCMNWAAFLTHGFLQLRQRSASVTMCKGIEFIPLKDVE